MFIIFYNSTRAYIPAKSSKSSPPFNEKQASVKLLSKILSLVPNNQTSPSLDPHSIGIVSHESKLQDHDVNRNCDDQDTTTNNNNHNNNNNNNNNNNIRLSKINTNLNLEPYAIEEDEYKDEINDDLGVSKEFQSDEESENESMSVSSGYNPTNLID